MYAYSVYPVDGTDYDVDFPYLDKSHVKVFTETSEVLTAVPFTWINPTRIRIAAPASSVDHVVVSRATSPSERLVDYSVPSSLSEEDLDTDSLQAFYLAQEANDRSELAKAAADSFFNAIRVNATETLFRPELPGPAERNGKVLGFDTEGQLKMIELTINTLNVTGFVQTLIDDADATEFMATLGVSAYFQGLVSEPDQTSLLSTLGASLLSQGLLELTTEASWRAALDVPATTVTIGTLHSIQGGGDLSASRTLALVGDVATPGNLKFYGTDATGARGWQSLPSASATEVQAGAVSDKAITPASTGRGSATGYGVNSVTIDITHNLGVRPRFISVFLRCVTADLGYAPGDELLVSPNFVGSEGSSGNYSIEVTTTQIKVRRYTTSWNVVIINKGTGAAQLANKDNWVFDFYWQV